MAFVEQNYDRKFAPNTRETFRRQVLHQFMQAKIVDYNPDNSDLPTNSPHAHYALTDAALSPIRAYGTKQWEGATKKFIKSHGTLLEIYSKPRQKKLIPIRLPEGKTLNLSPVSNK